MDDATFKKHGETRLRRSARLRAPIYRYRSVDFRKINKKNKENKKDSSVKMNMEQNSDESESSEIMASQRDNECLGQIKEIERRLEMEKQINELERHIYDLKVDLSKHKFENNSAFEGDDNDNILFHTPCKPIPVKCDAVRKNDDRDKCWLDSLNLQMELKQRKILFEKMNFNGSTSQGTDDEINMKEIKYVPHPQVVPDKRDNFDGQLEKLTCAITNAIKSVQRPSNETALMEKFVARQSCDKNLPVFSGKPEEWPSFISQYELTTKICGLSPIENLSRLQKCLKGDALEAVQSLLIMPNTVGKAIEILRLRFGNPVYVIESLLNKIRKLPQLRDEKIDLVIQFATQVQNVTATIEALKCYSYLNNLSLQNELVQRLPTNLKYQWALLLRLKPDMNLKEFGDWLHGVAADLSLIHIPKFEGDSSTKNETSKTKNIKKNHVFTTAEGETESEQKPKKCLFCDIEDHTVAKCNKFKALQLNERWEFVKKNKLCISCFGLKHRSKECKSKNKNENKCTIDDCKMTHNPLLHKTTKEVEKQSGTKGGVVAESVNHQTNTTKKIFLRVLPVKITNGDRELKTYALLDEASTVTLIDKTIADELELDGRSEKLNLTWTNDQQYCFNDSKRVSFGISGTFKGAKRFTINNARTVGELSLPKHSIDESSVKTMWPFLQQVDIESYEDVRPKILIGQDNQLLTIAREVVHRHWNEPIASKTWLGWTVHGNMTKAGIEGEPDFNLHIRETNDDVDLHQLVKSTFSIESFGVTVSKKNLLSRENQRAEQMLIDRTKRIGNRFESGLLWKNEQDQLPDNKQAALQRLYLLERKLKKDPELAKKYIDNINSYVEKGYARKLTPDELEQIPKKEWYLPHFPVRNPNKPNKFRMVLDAAAKVFGMSLNDFLMAGPDLLIPLLGVLFGFRENQIAVMGDIKEMFHQVKIREEDVDCQRFFWRGLNMLIEPEVFVMLSCIFGATCSPTIAQYAKNLNATEHEMKYPKAARAIKKKHYMDDYLDSFKTNEEAVQQINDVQLVHKAGGFQICNWSSNSTEVLSHLSTDLIAHGDKKLQPDDIERVLGLKWNQYADYFTFDLNFKKIDSRIVSGEIRPTKREVLGIVMSIFDPMGFVSHFVVQARILLQEVWKRDIGWDDELNDDLYQRWKNWLHELKNITNVKIPRCLFKCFDENRRIELHVFNDASQKAYASVAYFRIEYENHVDIVFVAAKFRVAPLKELSIPRLELLAAVMGSRLSECIKNYHNLEIDETCLWSDSRTVICWIRNTSTTFKQFVANRIGEISELTNIKNWRWIPTKFNVSDDATKENATSYFDMNNRWFNGPQFLTLPKDEWPEDYVYGEVTQEEIEVKEFTAFTREIETESEALPDLMRFSSWLKLIRTTATVQKAINLMRKQDCSSKSLMVADLINAEYMWCRNVQKEIFADEYGALLNGVPIGNRSKLYQLNPFLDENGLIRMNGRLVLTSEIDDNVKQPIVLPPKHRYTELLIMHYHEKAGHHGRERVLNELRQKYCILRIRAAVKDSWNCCQRCKNYRAGPTPPIMGNLPLCRIERPKRPFEFVGMDYFGPYFVTVDRSSVKRYGVLFTCLSIRAVHLEVAHSLTTDSTIMAVQRFIARRGYPRKIYSDNGTNLVGANNELKRAIQEFDQNKLRDHLSSNFIDWHFIPPATPHMGGAWERMVKNVKVALDKTVKGANLKDEILLTLFAEAENMVNSRPITYVSSDPNDFEALTPNCFLLGSSSAENTHAYGKFDESQLLLRKNWRIAQMYAERFWNIWSKNYLPSINRRSKWFGVSPQIKVDDVVYYGDYDGPGRNYVMGRVLKLYPGDDGKVRVVDLKTSDGVIRRPVAKLAVLDVGSREETESCIGGRMSPTATPK